MADAIAQRSAAQRALRSAADRFTNQVGHWTATRWAVPCRAAARGTSRADAVYQLIQALADLGAEAEGRASRTVPRLHSDLALPDQLAVMVVDLERAAATDATLRTASAAILATLASL